MNTENKKTFRRCFIFLLFWIVITLLGLLLVCEGGNGSAGFGPGSGAGDHGTGPGRGRGDSGTETGKGGAGDNPNAAATASGHANSPSDATVPTAKPPDKQPVKRTDRPDAPIRIVSEDNASKDIATIYIPKKGDPAGGSASGAATGFFGMKASGSVIFLLDVSGSMGSSTGDGNMSRLDLVKKEMAQTLKSRLADAKKNRSGDSFRIVCFSNGCSSYPETGERSFKFDSSSNVIQALNHVKGLSPCGGTSMKHAWNTIIPMIKRDKIRSVYFLSDGDPTDCQAQELLGLLKKSIPGIRINTISMGGSSELLKDIAKQHDGQYREVF